MDTYKIIIIAILIVVGLFFICGMSNRKLESDAEKFTALSGITGPLTSYDDYGTFDHMTDRYDPTFDLMCDKFENYGPETDPEIFIRYDGNNKLRRKLRGFTVRKNVRKYVDRSIDSFYPINGRDQIDRMVDTTRPIGALTDPKPFNWNFT